MQAAPARRSLDQRQGDAKCCATGDGKCWSRTVSVRCPSLICGEASEWVVLDGPRPLGPHDWATSRVLPAQVEDVDGSFWRCGYNCCGDEARQPTLDHAGRRTAARPMTASSREVAATGAAMTLPTNSRRCPSSTTLGSPPRSPMPGCRMSGDWTWAQAPSSRPAAAGGKAYE